MLHVASFSRRKDFLICASLHWSNYIFLDGRTRENAKRPMIRFIFRENENETAEDENNSLLLAVGTQLLFSWLFCSRHAGWRRSLLGFHFDTGQAIPDLHFFLQPVVAAHQCSPHTGQGLRSYVLGNWTTCMMLLVQLENASKILCTASFWMNIQYG